MEWADVMRRIKEEVEEKLKALPGGKPHWRVLWSYDNDKIHQDITLQAALKVGGRARAPLPPYSHDIHRVVEHALGRLKRAFNLWLYTHPGKRTMEGYMAAVQDIFYTQITAKSIRREVKKLPSVYRAIKEAKGDWPPRKFQ